MPFTRFIVVTMPDSASSFVPPWNCVYSPVAPIARRYVRSVAPDDTSGVAPASVATTASPVTPHVPRVPFV